MQPAINVLLREACASGVKDVVVSEVVIANKQTGTLPSFHTVFGSSFAQCVSTDGGVFQCTICLPIKQLSIAHRGRLALLTSQLHYPPARLFHKIAGHSEFPSGMEGVVDDVTSHIAASVDKDFPGLEGRSLHVSLVHNPSHLEVVGCVAAGKTRAKMKSGSKAMCLQASTSTNASGNGAKEGGRGMWRWPFTCRMVWGGLSLLTMAWSCLVICMALGFSRSMVMQPLQVKGSSLRHCPCPSIRASMSGVLCT